MMLLGFPAQCLLLACAVTKPRFPVGASPLPLHLNDPARKLSGTIRHGDIRDKLLSAATVHDDRT